MNYLQYLVYGSVLLIVSTFTDNQQYYHIPHAPILTESTPLLNAVTRNSREADFLLSPRSSVDASLASFLSIIQHIAKRLQKSLEINPDSSALVDTLCTIIYSQMRITTDTSQKEIRNILPHTVIEDRKGNCLGVSLLFLLCAEQIDYPLFGVYIPKHFFVRFDDGNTRRNIEPNKQGIERSDEYYKKRYGITADSRYMLQNLSKDQVIAVLEYSIAVICQEKGLVDNAVDCYKRCISKFPGFAEAWGNLALAYAAKGDNRSARRAFQKARTLDEQLQNLSYNFATFELSQKNYYNALRLYHHGLRTGPSDPALLYGIAFTYYSLKKYDSAYKYIRAVTHSDTASNAYILIKRIMKESDSP